jgi:hypothetical protein
LVGPGNGQFSQQIEVNLVPRRRFRGLWPAIEGLDAHALHQRGNVQPADFEPLLDQQPLQHPAARKREFHVQLAGPVHQPQIGIRHRAGLVVDTAPADQISVTTSAPVGHAAELGQQGQSKICAICARVPNVTARIAITGAGALKLGRQIEPECVVL